MITARIQIGDGQALDTFEGHGLIYLSGDNRTEAPVKKCDESSYPEQAGKNVDPRTVQDAFDHKVKFLVEAPNQNLVNANAKIAAFNAKLYTQEADSDIRRYKRVTLYDDYKRVKIVGIPDPIAEPEKLYRRQDGTVMDCAVVELTIHVDDPTKCDFNLSV